MFFPYQLCYVACVLEFEYEKLARPTVAGKGRKIGQDCCFFPTIRCTYNTPLVLAWIHTHQGNTWKQVCSWGGGGVMKECMNKCGLCCLTTIRMQCISLETTVRWEVSTPPHVIAHIIIGF